MDYVAGGKDEIRSKSAKAGALVCAVGVVVALAIAPQMARAQSSREVVVVTYGGSTTDAQREAFYKPFEEATGIKVIEDAPPDPIKVRAMVESKNVTWDVIDLEEEDMLALSKLGLLAPIDSKYFNGQTKAGLGTEGIREFGVREGYSASLIAWNTTKYNRDTAPKNWADFWNVQAFPGKRVLTAGTFVDTPFEAALLADGVPIANLYPLDIDRAFRSLSRIRPHVVKWTNASAEAVQLLISGEADIAMVSFSRIAKAKFDDHAPVDYTFNEAYSDADFWSIVKNAPHYDNALRYLAFVSEARQQANRTLRQHYGPANQDAFKLLPSGVEETLPSYGPNLTTSIRGGAGFWSQVTPESKSMREKIAELWRKWVAQ